MVSHIIHFQYVKHNSTLVLLSTSLEYDFPPRTRKVMLSMPQSHEHHLPYLRTQDTVQHSHCQSASSNGLAEPQQAGLHLLWIPIFFRIIRGHLLWLDYRLSHCILPLLSSTLTLLHSLHSLWPQKVFDLNLWEYPLYLFSKLLLHILQKSMSQQFPIVFFLHICSELIFAY